jgi:hypothetical protein
LSGGRDRLGWRECMAVVGEPEAAGVPQHVRMNEKGEFGGHARPGDHALISSCGERGATFRNEDVWGRWRFAQELAQCPAFPGPYRMHAGIPALGPTHMQAPGGEVDVVPSQRHDLRGSEAVAVRDQDGRGVPMPAAVLLCGLHEPLDLSFAAKLAVILAGESPANRGCPVAVVVISSNGKGDRPVESLEVKAPGG